MVAGRPFVVTVSAVSAGGVMVGNGDVAELRCGSFLTGKRTDVKNM
jgi:hypothetical protein